MLWIEDKLATEKQDIRACLPQSLTHGQQRTDVVMKIDVPIHEPRQGVYGIVNRENGKWYIGQSNHMQQRKSSHFSALRNNRHGNEQKHLSKEHRAKISRCLRGNKYRLGKPHTPETIRLLSELNSKENNQFFGKHHSEFTKMVLSVHARGNKYCLGRKLSEETKQRIAQKLLGKKLSEETRMKMRLARNRRIRSNE
jgi:hypothetical protein